MKQELYRKRGNKMKMEFYGAAGCVTGSCHILRVQDKTILLDCGMYQGKDEKERSNENFHFDPKKVDYVILSHAHIDHSGRIPLLYKKGFKGKVLCTEATKDLCSVMLPDSGHISEMEAEWENRKRIRKGLELVEPLYTVKIATLSTFLFEGHPYNTWIELFEGCKIRFQNAGHLLGAAIVEIYINDNGKETKLVYSGDLGNKNLPILPDPTFIDYADYVIMETTYGSRLHHSIDTSLEELVKIIKQTVQQGGNVIIPSFAVGRTQEVLYAINKHVENKSLKGVTFYVDSPLAAESTRIFEKHLEDFDEEAQKLIEAGDDPLDFEGLVFTQSVEESMELNEVQQGAVIISASGMCEAGRIKHHLKHNLWRKECAVVFVGYQAEGTLGRAIVNGVKTVKLFGEEVAVNARICNLEGLSGHADQQGLLNWIEHFQAKPKEILLVHGDRDAQENFKSALTQRGYIAKIMGVGESYDFDIAGREKGVKEKIFSLLDTIDVEHMSKKELLEKLAELLEEKE